jgi:hypothetical protein
VKDDAEKMVEAMDEFFATHAYDRQDDWRETPETAADPDDEPEEQKR